MAFVFLAGCSTVRDTSIVGTSLPERTIVPQNGLDEVTARSQDSDGVQLNRRLETEELGSFAISLGFESIRPIYAPKFFVAEQAALDDEELVLGVA